MQTSICNLFLLVLLLRSHELSLLGTQDLLFQGGGVKEMSKVYEIGMLV